MKNSNSRHQKKREQKRAARSLRSKQKKKERRKALYKLLYRSGQQDEENQQEFPEVLDLGSGKDLMQAGKIIPKSKAFETQKGNK